MKIFLFCKIILISIWLMFIDEIDGAKTKRKKISSRRVSNPNDFWWIIKVTYAGVFLPVILYFVYNIIRDPMFPRVMKRAWRVLKRKTFSYLGTNGATIQNIRQPKAD